MISNQTKVCKKCKIEQDINLFSKNGKYHKNKCRNCEKEYYDNYRASLEYKTKRSRYYKNYSVLNKDKIRNKRIQYKQRKNELARLEYNSKIEKDIQFTLKLVLRRRLKAAIKRNYKTGSAVRDLGCSIEELKKHLESKFKEGMTWENYGNWHIDHIKPLSSFDLTDREQFLQACHFTNLQPLWADENLRKSDKYDSQERIGC